MSGQIKLLNAPMAGEGAAPAPVPAQQSVNTIEQVRELLYGDAMRNQGRRVEDLSGEMRDLEQRMLQRFEEMQNAMDALARALRLEQGNAIRGIGMAVIEVGRQIAALGDVRERTHSDPKV